MQVVKIDDEQLAGLFRAESDEHLHAIEQGLLQLETDNMDRSALANIRRGAHSLKGSAGMLGVTRVEVVAHRFEDILEAALGSGGALAARSAELLYATLDDLRKLVTEALSGTPSGVDLEAVLARLFAAEIEHVPAAELAMPREDASTVRVAVRSAAEAADVYHIDTIRVEPAKLDELMRQAGELRVTTTRVAQRMADLNDVITTWEELERESFASRSVLAQAERKGDNAAFARVRSLHERSTHRLDRLGTVLTRFAKDVNEDHARLDVVVNEIEDGIRKIRLIPLSMLFGLFPRTVRDIAKTRGKEVRLVVEGGETTADKRVIEDMKDPLMHVIRNAVDHGAEEPEARESAGKPRQATIQLRASRTATHIVIEVSDDGRGLDVDAIKRIAVRRRIATQAELDAMTTRQVHGLIFQSGFSTAPIVTDVSGRGVGLDVVRANVERLKGTIQVESRPGRGCTFRIQVPITLSTARVLVLDVDGRRYAIPVDAIETIRRVTADDVFLMDGRETIHANGHPASVARLSMLLELGGALPKTRPWPLPCVLLQVENERFGILVDAVVDEQEVVLKPLSGLLRRVRNVSGATILGTGQVCIVLNPTDLLQTLRKAARPAPQAPASGRAVPAAPKRILLVEDSITTRTQLKRILETAGYVVVAAVDGADAFSKMGDGKYDAVVTDVDMPNMDGLALAERLRKDQRLKDLPIVLVTSRAKDEEKQRGIEAGADAYITKTGFDQALLLDALRRLI